jgi:hypothetical protein
MYTEKRFPGKFEGCASEKVGEILLNAVGESYQSDEFGDCSEYGEWLGLIKGKRFWFIVREDNYGFFDYSVGKPEAIKVEWDSLVEEYEQEMESREEYEEFEGSENL